MKLGIYGHCTIDTISVDGSSYVRPGGSACYCGHAAKSMGADVVLHTKFGPDFDHVNCLDRPGIRRHADALTETPTTRFRINVHGTKRDLYLENRCDPLSFEGGDADGIIVSPIMGEISFDVLSQIVGSSGNGNGGSSKMIFVDPQGFLRRVPGDRGSGGPIYLEKTDIDLSGIDLIKASRDEMEALVGCTGTDGMRALQKKGARYVLYTDGADISLLDGDRLYSLKIPNSNIHDTTGAGDILVATFACAMIKEADSIWAICFAGGAVQAALDTWAVGLEKAPKRGATTTNASYFYNTIGFRSL